MKILVAILALILTSIGTHAAEIYSQPLAPGGGGYLSSTYSSGGSNAEKFV